METQTGNLNPGAGAADGGRFAPYVAELREFFTSSGMRFGTPEDLVAFAQALKEPGTFREELASLTRSVLYREQGKIATTELLELMMVAMGGARIAEAGESAREPVRELLGFLGKAMRGGRAEALDDVENHPGPVDFNSGVVAVAGVVDATAVGGVHSHAATEFYSRAQSISMGAETAVLEVMSSGDSDAEPSLVRPPVALALRPTANDDAKRRSSRVEWGLFGCAAAGMVMAAVMFVHPWAGPAAGRVEEPTIFAVGSADGAAAGGSSDFDSRAGAGIPAESASTVSGAAVDATAVRPETSGSFGRAKPAAGEPMFPAAVRGTSGGSMRTTASMGRLPSKRMGVYTVSSGVMAGKLISAPKPEYPKLAGLIHMEGQVTLQAVVGQDGRVVATHVLQGHRLLRGAASNAVRQWRYRPYLVNGQPADVATIVTVNFRRR